MDKSDKEFFVKRYFTLPKTSKLTKEAVLQFDNLFISTSPEEYRNTLIEIYHAYLYLENSGFPNNFAEMAGQMHFLIEFFRRISEEIKVCERDNKGNG